MRLIDGDHLKSILQEYVKREKSYVELGEFPTKLIASCVIYGLEEAIAQIDSEPSVQPERKKGKWIEEEKGIHVTSYRCSECGRTVMDDTGYDVSADYPFCNCGADMRGEANAKSKN